MFKLGPHFHFEIAVIRDKQSRNNESRLYIDFMEVKETIDKLSEYPVLIYHQIPTLNTLTTNRISSIKQCTMW